MLNVGIGIGPTIYGNISVPPLMATLDYNLPIKDLPFFFGGFFEFAGTESKMNFTSDVKYTDTVTFLSVGGRFGYHLNWAADKIDTYVVAGLGWTLFMVNREKSGDWTGFLEPEENNKGSFLFDFSLGARYFFIPNIGIFGEIGGGYNSLSTISLGLSVKI
ncbi:hypothetical protein FACS1894151_05990 [Spirochaetia bacterium]|nr:hypothetical protein FACS1894151_05990 [Spirochaetia bacterium]